MMVQKDHGGSSGVLEGMSGWATQTSQGLEQWSEARADSGWDYDGGHGDRETWKELRDNQEMELRSWSLMGESGGERGK